MTQRNFHPQKLLHIETFTQRNFYAQKFLHTETFTHRRFLAKNLYAEEFLYKENLSAQTRLHTIVFTHRNFCAEKSLPIFHHVSFFHNHSLSVIFIALLSCSFGQFPPSLTFYFARCSVRPRFVLAPSAAKQAKREPRNKQRLITKQDRFNYISRNSDQKNVDVAGTTCCGELWPLMSSQ